MWAHLGIAVGVGTGAELFAYVVAMLATASPSDSTTDNAAGAGVAILTVPTAVVLGVLLAVGALAGLLTVRSRRQPVTP